MAIKVWAPPAELKKPKWNSKTDWQQHRKNTEAYFERIKKFCAEQGSGKYKGEVVRFPFADGQAIYVVYSSTPMELIHCDIYDAYDYPYITRLSKRDIIDEIESEKRMEQLRNRGRK